MLERHDNIWNQINKSDIICVTTNLCLAKDKAIMGAGIAKQAADRYPDCASILGQALASGKRCPTKIAQDGKTEIWSFPTKLATVQFEQLLPQYKTKYKRQDPNSFYPGWMGYSDLQLIVESAIQLKASTANKIVAIPRPGCGKGGLEWERVKTFLEPILDSNRFTIYN